MDDLDPIPLDDGGSTDATIVTPPSGRAPGGSNSPANERTVDPSPANQPPTIAPANQPPTIAAANSVTTAAALAKGRVDPIIGKEIGGVTISALVGEGGMGRVYVGTVGGGTLRAAVKLLSRGFDNPEAIGRFQREAAILDRLRHPGIAEIRGHGVWDDGAGGIPYMVLEFVEDAKTLADFAAEHRLDRRGRLELFHRACEAVAFAHQMKVLHRDLKPANLLVDRFGRVKVIDFGVARSSNGDLGVASVRTETGQMIGTVQYMSPEQIAGDPRAIDLRTDVYALGVILYEMLVDAHPYDVRGLPLPEAARIVSMAQVEPPRLRDPSIDEALDAIAMRCLARAPDGRFESAGALAAALERYLYPRPKAMSASSSAAQAAVGPDGRERANANDDLALVPIEHRARAGERSSRGRGRGGRVRAPMSRAAGGKGARWAWPVTVGVVVLAAGAGAVLTGALDLREWRRLIPGGSGGAGSPAGASASPSTINMENLTVLSAPEGALVTIDGTVQGRTPLTMMVAWTSGSTTRSVEVSAPGFETTTGLLLPDPDGRRADSLRMVFNLVPTQKNRDANLERLLPLRVEGGPVEVRLPNGRVEKLLPGLREIRLSMPRSGDSYSPVSISLRSPGHRIDAFERSADGEITVVIDPKDNLDHARVVRIAAP